LKLHIAVPRKVREDFIDSLKQLLEGRVRSVVKPLLPSKAPWCAVLDARDTE
jgi:hypothetical protein